MGSGTVFATNEIAFELWYNILVNNAVKTRVKPIVHFDSRRITQGEWDWIFFAKLRKLIPELALGPKTLSWNNFLSAYLLSSGS